MMMHRHIRILSDLVLAVLLVIGVVAPAQTITGSIHGTVVDPAGNIVVGAAVTATSVETNQSTAATTNNVGVYNIRFLQVGHYKVTVAAPGFSQQSFGPITLEADQDVALSAQMQVQGSEQQVEVHDDGAPLLNTENATLGTTLDSTAIDNVALNGRDFVSLTLFTPGAVSTNPGSLIGTVAITGEDVRNTPNGSPSINGNRQQQNNYLLDGIEMNETIRNTVGYDPSPDALDQVRVISANAQAEFGNVNGGDVVAITRVARIRGMAVRSTTLRTTIWMLTPGRTSITQQSFRNRLIRSRFSGGTLGGPITHNKLFFFADYSGGRYHSGGLGTATVATAKMRTGDYSELLDPAIMCGAAGGAIVVKRILIQLYDSQNNFASYASRLGIPILNPVAEFLYSHPSVYPLPNQRPQVGTPATNNYVGVQKSGARNDQGDIKIDWKVTANDQLSVRYSQSDSDSTLTNPLAVTFPLEPYSLVKGTAINWVHIVSPEIVNEFRARLQSNRIRGWIPNGRDRPVWQKWQQHSGYTRWTERAWVCGPIVCRDERIRVHRARQPGRWNKLRR